MGLTKELLDQMLAARQGTPRITPQPFQNFAPLSLVNNYGPDKAQSNAFISAINDTEQAQHAQFMTALANDAQAKIVAGQRGDVRQLRDLLHNAQDAAPPGSPPPPNNQQGSDPKTKPQGNQKPKQEPQPPPPSKPKTPKEKDDQKAAATDATKHMQVTLPPSVLALASKYRVGPA